MACLVSLTVKVGGVDHKLPENVHTFKKMLDDFPHSG